MRLRPALSTSLTALDNESRIRCFVLDNGLVVVAESMPWLDSAAFSLSVPAGCLYDPAGRGGLANFACDMVQRGCGQRDSRRFIEDLEWLGVEYGSSASLYHTHFWGACPAEHLLGAIAIYGDVVRRPWLPADQTEDSRRACWQDIRSIEDDLAEKALVELRLRHYGDPLGRSGHGSIESVGAITLDDVAQFVRQRYLPQGTILSVAGRIDFDRLVESISEIFGTWTGPPAPEVAVGAGLGGNHHLAFDSNQTHIAVAYPTVPYAHADYFPARVAVGVLSDGSSSRLFAELRERRGLCYSVFAVHHSLVDRASVVAYVGTSAERAQESLDVLVGQLEGLAQGIEPAELDRLRIQVRSSLVMQQESCRSRAAAISSDWFHLGRVRTLDEINRAVGGLSVEAVNRFLRQSPPQRLDVVTLGPAPLELRHDARVAPAG